MYDIIIVGSGGAALSCAIVSKQKGYKVLVVTKTTNTASQTVQAQGGINGVFSKYDNIDLHIKDTLKASTNIADKNSIKFMCKNGSKTIKWLDDLGVPFSRDLSNNLIQRQMGGSSKNRTCYSSDYTGLKILQTLFDTALKYGVEFKEEHMLLNIIKDNNIVRGITALDIKTSNVKQLLAKNVIIATGGYGGVYHNYTTNSSATTGDGIVSAFKIGVTLSNMEFIQFHPTALKDKYILISESARAEGGYLVTKDGKRFVDELKPRDVVARAIYDKILNSEDIFLDVRALGYEKIMKLMPQEYKLCFNFSSLKMDKDLIPIIPASHYTMGGIKVDLDGKTNIKSLYAIGEVACNGVHGANRLGGNSLLEIITFGIHIANNIIIDNTPLKDTIYDRYSKDIKRIDDIFNNNYITDDFYKAKDKLGKLMFENVGLYRDEKSLKKALDLVDKYIDNFSKFGIIDKDKNYNSNLKDYLEFENMLVVSKVIIKSAIQRKESRGSHYRTDYENIDIFFDKETLFHIGDLDG